MTKKHADKPYRPCVGVVLFNSEGKVFVAERIDTPGAWQLPQGGIDKGEKPKQAALRELEEEIGTRSVEVIGKSRDWLRYDLPEDIAGRIWGGKYRGQEQRWFAMRFLGDDSEIDLEAHGHPEFSAWQWVELDRIPELIVGFKRPIYEALVEEFRHLAR